ncbi:YezD family protein [Paenibacillus lutrae]|uniref:DUF2292 domain-containing protein n=1 Tax=Paenibacillus lutrae TaxID=2078573 RepID=A0A7X3JZL0_9BACL|nr:YezD family protein [Paenibacillus lutrae]MVP00294.1 DUF2292 domain-containing protein [Paenibacillus lutrae]
MAKPVELNELWIERIIQSINGLEYGTVQIIIHDGRIAQIERTERKRFDNETKQAANGTKLHVERKVSDGRS